MPLLMFGVALFLAAANAASPVFVTELSQYKQLKAREATLQMLIRRAPALQRDKYEAEYKALKPKLYESAERAETGVRVYQQKHGLKALCAATPTEFLDLVPACEKKRPK